LRIDAHQPARLYTGTPAGIAGDASCFVVYLSTLGAGMETIDIKDPKGNVIGHIETQDDGNQVLKDLEGSVRGYYDRAGDYTRGPDQQILAKGNKLRSLMC
jgi:hypothetical protein